MGEVDKVMKGSYTIDGMSVRGGGAYDNETEDVYAIFIVTLNGDIIGRHGVSFDGMSLQGEKGSKRHETRLLLGPGGMINLLSGLVSAVSQHTGRSVNDILLDVQEHAEQIELRREEA